MSNTCSSHPVNSEAARRSVVRELVAERAGREWCLFVDRDGVINRQVVGDYVRSWRDFEWVPRSKPALRQLREWAPDLVVVTNQQGIGKGLMSAHDVAAIHENLEAELELDGASVDAFRVCPHLESSGCNCRKPRTGLVLDWLAGHPESVPNLSIMVGDSPSDLELARNVATATGGCASIAIGGCGGAGANADAMFKSLWDFAVAVGHARGEQSS